MRINADTVREFFFVYIVLTGKIVYNVPENRVIAYRFSNIRKEVDCMKKFLISLTMLLCILLLFSVAFAEEAPDICIECGDTARIFTPYISGTDNYHQLRCATCYTPIGMGEKCTPIAGTATCELGPKCEVCGFHGGSSATYDLSNHTCTKIQMVEPTMDSISSFKEVVLTYLTKDCYAVATIGGGRCPAPEQTSARTKIKVSGNYSCTKGGRMTLTIPFKESWLSKVTESIQLPPIGEHEYRKTEVVAPTCTQDGYTRYTCIICGDTYTTDVTSATLHWFDLWTPNEDSTHGAPCRLCTHIGVAPCSTTFEVTAGETVITVCPVCGEAGEAVFEAIADAEVKSATRMVLPTGEAIVRGMEAPFDGVLYAFTAAYEYSGEVIPFGTTVSVSLPLSAEQYASFELVRVDVTPAAGDAERTEVRTAVPYTFESDVLTFEADAAALYLLIAR